MEARFSKDELVALERDCGPRAARVALPLIEAAERHPGDALLGWTHVGNERTGHVTVKLASSSAERADFEIVLSTSGDHGYASYVGEGACIDSWEPLESEEEAQEIADHLCKLLASPIEVLDTKMDGVLYDARYRFEDEDETSARWCGRKPRMFGRGETSLRRFAAW